MQILIFQNFNSLVLVIYHWQKGVLTWKHIASSHGNTKYKQLKSFVKNSWNFWKCEQVYVMPTSKTQQSIFQIIGTTIQTPLHPLTYKATSRKQSYINWGILCQRDKFLYFHGCWQNLEEKKCSLPHLAPVPSHLNQIT